MGEQKGKINGYGYFITLAVVAISFVFFSLLSTNDRVKLGLKAISNDTLKQSAIKDGRPIIWRSAIQVIRNHLIFGVGIGDVKTELMTEYQKTGNKDLIEKQYNVHNQFLEILLEDGMVGLLLFMALVIFMFWIAFSRKSVLYLLFLVMIILFFTFETVLYRFAGVSFFSLFSFTLLHLKPASKPPVIQNSNL